MVPCRTVRGRRSWSEALAGRGPSIPLLSTSQRSLDTQEAGANTVDLAADPRVAYLLIESEQIRWRLTLQEGVAGSPVSESARD